MEATPKQRENFVKIRIKISEPAVKELTEKDGWLIPWLWWKDMGNSLFFSTVTTPLRACATVVMTINAAIELP